MSSNRRTAFDPANFVQCKVVPVTQAYPLVQDYVSYIHIKDAIMANGSVVPAGEGNGQLCELLQELNGKGFSGFMSLEPHLSAKGKAENLSNPELFVVASKALKKLLAEKDMKWS